MNDDSAEKIFKASNVVAVVVAIGFLGYGINLGISFGGLEGVLVIILTVIVGAPIVWAIRTLIRGFGQLVENTSTLLHTLQNIEKESSLQSSAQSEKPHLAENKTQQKHAEDIIEQKKVRCPKCGAKNDFWKKSCNKCGENLI